VSTASHTTKRCVPSVAAYAGFPASGDISDPDVSGSWSTDIERPGLSKSWVATPLYNDHGAVFLDDDEEVLGEGSSTRTLRELLSDPVGARRDAARGLRQYRHHRLHGV